MCFLPQFQRYVWKARQYEAESGYLQVSREKDILEALRWRWCLHEEIKKEKKGKRERERKNYDLNCKRRSLDLIKNVFKTGCSLTVMVHVINPSTWETKLVYFYEFKAILIIEQPGPCREILSHKKCKKLYI